MIVERGMARRGPAWLLVLAIWLFCPLAGLVSSPSPARAQAAAGEVDPREPEPGELREDGEAGAHEAAGAGARGAARAGEDGAAGNVNEGSAGAALFFWLFALMIVAGSIFVITRRNLISAVMGMVATFFAIAAVYAMLYAHFLAAIQVLVYAGAIMVLFVFVIMILNKPEDEPWSHWSRAGTVGNAAAVVVIGYLLWRVGQVLWNVPVDPGMFAPPAGVEIAHLDEPVDFGSTMAIGQNLFREYLFPFEAVSLVLLIAVVGALAVARPHEKPPAATPSDESSSA